jgi:hypothetical protein
LVVKQEGHGVREDFAQQSTSKVPEVACPDPLYGITFGELRKDGVYPVAKPTEEGAPFWVGISFLGGVRSQKLHTNAGQLLPGLWRMVVAISYEKARSSLGDLWEHAKLMGIGRGHRDAADHPRQAANPHVHPKAVESLLEEGVLAESSFPFEALAAMGSGEQASRQGHRVADSEGRVRGQRR